MRGRAGESESEGGTERTFWQQHAEHGIKILNRQPPSLNYKKNRWHSIKSSKTRHTERRLIYSNTNSASKRNQAASSHVGAPRVQHQAGAQCPCVARGTSCFRMAACSAFEHRRSATYSHGCRGHVTSTRRPRDTTSRRRSRHTCTCTRTHWSRHTCTRGTPSHTLVTHTTPSPHAGLTSQHNLTRWRRKGKKEEKVQKRTKTSTNLVL